jgi:hypothetical protein
LPAHFGNVFDVACLDDIVSGQSVSHKVNVASGSDVSRRIFHRRQRELFESTSPIPYTAAQAK